MQNNSSPELSARHLPDVSDASISFQIPAGLDGDLLMDDNEGFLDGLADTLATPVLRRVEHDNLTLSQLTPKQTAKPKGHHATKSCASTTSALTSSSQFNRVQSSTIQTFKEKVLGPKPSNRSGVHAKLLDEGTSTLKRLENLKEKVETLFEGSNPSTSTLPPTFIHTAASASSHATENENQSGEFRTRQLKSNSPAKNTGNTKSQTGRPMSGVTPRVNHTESAPDVLRSDEKVNVGVNDSSYADTSVISTTDGGLAEKLVIYGQGLIGSQLLPEPGNSYQGLESASTASSTIQTLASEDGASNSMDEPLTLSQLSPSKEGQMTVVSNGNSGQNLPPLRPSRKRPSSEASNDQPRKKGKVVVPRVGGTASASRASAQKKRVNTGSTSGRITAKLKERSCHGVAMKNARMKPVMSKSSSTSVSALPPVKAGESSKKNVGAVKSESLFRSTGNSKHDVQRSRQNESQLSSSEPTRPITFEFQSDMRIEARERDREQEQEQGRTAQSRVKRLHTPYLVPDFKSSHATLSTAMASRKERLTPVVPLSIEMHTEARAKARSKFDDRVKEKEKEKERVMEQRRRELQEEEERELKELRRKAVPKAHEVPEWYKDAPKRKERNTRGEEEVKR